MQLTSTHGWEFRVESVGLTSSRVGSNEEVPGIAAMLNHSSHFQTGGQEGGIWRLFGTTAPLRTMLADKIERLVAIRVRPQPSLGSVEASTVSSTSGHVPEGHGHVATIQPLPVVRVLGISDGSQPVLRRGVGPVTPPHLPTQETLQCGVAVVD